MIDNNAKIFVTGHRGILGRALMGELGRRGFAAVGVDVAEVDITDAGRLRAILERETPDVVVNCAAFTRVDECEERRDLCFDVNAGGAGTVAAEAAEVGARVIHIGTDYVFDGRARGPYGEDAETGPLSVYGESKLEGERLVAEAAADHLIVRTASLFGLGGVSFVSKILTRAKNGESLRVVEDQRCSPTYAAHLAEALAALLHVEYRGIVNVVNAGSATWFEVAREILKLTGNDVPLEPVATADLDLPAPRPAYSVLSISRFTGLTGHVMPTWQEGLAAYLRELKEVKEVRADAD
ncbi:MAG: dTDP-4-dehydrorhamnose reductase [Candidatus Zixiibacteriota bacterium]